MVGRSTILPCKFDSKGWRETRNVCERLLDCFSVLEMLDTVAGEFWSQIWQSNESYLPEIGQL